MASCWRELARQEQFQLFVVAFRAGGETDFADQLMAGIPHRLLNQEERQNEGLIQELVAEFDPDVIVLPGWLHAPYRNLPSLKTFQEKKFIMCMDTPYWGKIRQKVAPFALRSFLKRMDLVVVSGERSWQYARRLGFAHRRIFRGQYGIDYDFFKTFFEQRIQGPWPRNFLFLGRFSEVKAVDILVEAYQLYRARCKDEPWNLICCGKGKLEHLLEDQTGISNYGFVQPADLGKVFRKSGAFIMPSRFDPWPLSIIEASAAGLPVICTEICGSAVEIVKSWYNGFTIPENDAEALAEAMQRIDQLYNELPEFGRRAVQQAAPYSSKVWVRRWQHIIQETLGFARPTVTPLVERV